MKVTGEIVKRSIVLQGIIQYCIVLSGKEEVVAVHHIKLMHTNHLHANGTKERAD